MHLYVLDKVVHLQQRLAMHQLMFGRLPHSIQEAHSIQIHIRPLFARYWLVGQVAMLVLCLELQSQVFGRCPRLRIVLL